MTLTATEARSKLYRLIDEAAPYLFQRMIGGLFRKPCICWIPLVRVNQLMWRDVFTNQAQKDAKKLSAVGLRPKAEKPIEILHENPYQTPPPVEKLLGDLSGTFSRRINIQHRLVYQILDEKKAVKVIRIWTHYK